MPDCRALSSHEKNPPVITKANLYDIIPSKYDLNPGTKVTISCAPGLELHGESSFTCLPNGEWSYTKIPVCEETETNTDKAWTDSTRNMIIVCVLWALAAIVFFALLVKIVGIMIRKRRENINKYKERHQEPKGSYIHHGERHHRIHADKLGHHHEIFQNNDNDSTVGHHHNNHHNDNTGHHNHTGHHNGAYSHHKKHGEHKHLNESHGHGHNSKHSHGHRHEHGHGHNQGHGHGKSQGHDHGDSYRHGHGNSNGHGHGDSHGHGHVNSLGYDHGPINQSIYDQVSGYNEALPEAYGVQLQPLKK